MAAVAASAPTDLRRDGDMVDSRLPVLDWSGDLYGRRVRTTSSLACATSASSTRSPLMGESRSDDMTSSAHRPRARNRVALITQGRQTRRDARNSPPPTWRLHPRAQANIRRGGVTHLRGGVRRSGRSQKLMPCALVCSGLGRAGSDRVRLEPGRHHLEGAIGAYPEARSATTRRHTESATRTALVGDAQPPRSGRDPTASRSTSSRSLGAQFDAVTALDQVETANVMRCRRPSPR